MRMMTGSTSLRWREDSSIWDKHLF
jgi:hypothetical protein